MATSTAKVTITAEDKTASAFASVKQQLTGLQTSVSNFKRSITGGIISAAVILEGVRALEGLGKVVYDDTVKWQSWQYALEAGGLSSKETNDELTYLQDTCIKLGLNITDVGQAFSRFVLTGRATGMSLDEINKDFTAVSGAMRIFHLTGQQTTRSWLALTEVMSMGNLQSRQFTQQLGRDWAGIGPLLAKNFQGAGGSIQKFIEMMKAGQISSQQFLDTFPKLMENPAFQGALAGAVDSIQASMGRLQTAMFGLFNEAQNPAALSGITDALNELTKTINDPAIKQGFDNLIAGIIKLVDWAAKAASWLGTLGEAVGTLAGRMATGIDQSGTELSMLQDNINVVKQRIEELQAAIPRGGLMGLSVQQTTDQLKQAQNELALLQKGMAGLQSGKAGTAASSSTDTVGAPVKVPTPALDIGTPEQLDYLRQAQVRVDQVQTMGMAVQPILEQINALIVQNNALLNQMPTEKMEKLKLDSKKSTDQITEFGVQAAHNMQSMFAKFLFDPFAGGLRGMVANFTKAMAQMVEQAIAAQLLKQMFGGFSNSTNPLLAGIAQGVMGTTTSGRAGGGSVDNGETYLVGESGPELFRPGASGTIIPNHALQGSSNVSHTVNIDARGAGPDEVAKLLSMQKDLENSIRGQVEYRIQRGSWTQAPR